MKKHVAVTILMLGVVVLAGNRMAEAGPGTAFDKLKVLAGEWTGKNSEGHQLKVTYEISSGGSTLLEKTESSDEPTMLTIYHMDNGDLRLTHYCSAGNQPRMRAASVSPDAREILFEFVDVTNLKGATDGYINSLTLTIQNNNHITQKWGWFESGKQEYSTVHLTRVK